MGLQGEKVRVVVSFKEFDGSEERMGPTEEYLSIMRRYRVFHDYDWWLLPVPCFSLIHQGSLSYAVVFKKAITKALF